MTKYYGVVVFTLLTKEVYPLDAEADHKPQTESGGLGAFCNWYQSIEDRDKYIDYLLHDGFLLDIEECDKYYGIDD